MFVAPSHHYKPSVFLNVAVMGRASCQVSFPVFLGGSSVDLLGKHFIVAAMTSGNQKTMSNV